MDASCSEVWCCSGCSCESLSPLYAHTEVRLENRSLSVMIVDHCLCLVISWDHNRWAARLSTISTEILCTPQGCAKTVVVLKCVRERRFSGSPPLTCTTSVSSIAKGLWNILHRWWKNTSGGLKGFLKCQTVLASWVSQAALSTGLNKDEPFGPAIDGSSPVHEACLKLQITKSGFNWISTLIFSRAKFGCCVLFGSIRSCVPGFNSLPSEVHCEMNELAGEQDSSPQRNQTARTLFEQFSLMFKSAQSSLSRR